MTEDESFKICQPRWKLLTRYHYQIPKLIILISPVNFLPAICFYQNIGGHSYNLEQTFAMDCVVHHPPKEKITFTKIVSVNVVQN